MVNGKNTVIFYSQALDYSNLDLYLNFPIPTKAKIWDSRCKNCSRCKVQVWVPLPATDSSESKRSVDESQLQSSDRIGVKSIARMGFPIPSLLNLYPSSKRSFNVALSNAVWFCVQLCSIMFNYVQLYVIIRYSQLLLAAAIMLQFQHRVTLYNTIIMRMSAYFDARVA